MNLPVLYKLYLSSSRSILIRDAFEFLPDFRTLLMKLP